MALDFLADKAKQNAKKMGRRAGEKLLRQMGAAETRDQEFDDLQSCFTHQVMQSERLRKDMKRYLDLVKETRKALKSVNDVLADFYEDTWPRNRDFQISLQDHEQLWSNLERGIHSLRDPIRRYDFQFQDVIERKEKRENKLVDYDHTRRQLEKAYNDQRISDDRIADIEDKYLEREATYNELNTELKQEMTKVIQSRVGFMAECFGKFATVHEVFASETKEVMQALNVILGDLALQDLPIPAPKRQTRGRNLLKQNNSDDDAKTKGKLMKETTATSGQPMALRQIKKKAELTGTEPDVKELQTALGLSSGLAGVYNVATQQQSTPLVSPQQQILAGSNKMTNQQFISQNSSSPPVQSLLSQRLENQSYPSPPQGSGPVPPPLPPMPR
ncbi:bridging integrator 2-like [Tubulanus polymorphus]|uniref:bridging integrator 2-like n=1 Tax=Tubulanus polymorphus TaxID=672921 RepID=UPI003DA3230C